MARTPLLITGLSRTHGKLAFILVSLPLSSRSMQSSGGVLACALRCLASVSESCKAVSDLYAVAMFLLLP